MQHPTACGVVEQADHIEVAALVAIAYQRVLSEDLGLHRDIDDGQLVGRVVSLLGRRSCQRVAAAAKCGPSGLAVDKP